MMALMAETRQKYQQKEIGTVDGIQTEIKQYCKIPKISPRAYIFQRPFLRGLSTEENLFQNRLGQLYCWQEIYQFSLFYCVFEGYFQVQAPGGAYIWRGDLTESFLHYEFRGLIFGGAYIWRGLFSEFYGIQTEIKQHVYCNLLKETTSDHISQPLRDILF